MVRLVLSGAQWERMAPHCLGKKTDPGRSGGDNRLFVEAVLWKVQTNSPWRDLPAAFGDWSTVFKRFACWSKSGAFPAPVNPAGEGACVPVTVFAVGILARVA
jgi:transposase